ncbi:MAG: hypothetical protein WCE21_04730 [Candidatus Babeliales bacterium]
MKSMLPLILSVFLCECAFGAIPHTMMPIADSYGDSRANPPCHSYRFHPKLNLFDDQDASTFTLSTITIDKFPANSSFQISDVSITLENGKNALKDLLTAQVPTDMLQDVLASSKSTNKDITITQISAEGYAPSVKIWVDKEANTLKFALYSPSVNVVNGYQINSKALADYLIAKLNKGKSRHCKLVRAYSAFTINDHAIQINLNFNFTPDNFTVSSLDIIYFEIGARAGNSIPETEKILSLSTKELGDNRILQKTSISKDLFTAQQTSGSTTSQDTSKQGSDSSSQSGSTSNDTSSSDSSSGLLF